MINEYFDRLGSKNRKNDINLDSCNRYDLENKMDLNFKVQCCIERSLEQADILQQLRSRSRERKSSQKKYCYGKSTSRSNQQQFKQDSNKKDYIPIQLFFQDENKENQNLNYPRQINNRMELDNINFDQKQDELEKLFIQTIQRSRQITKNFIFSS